VTTELLGFHASGVSNEETLVVRNKQLLELSLSGLIVVLLVVGDQSLGDSHTDGHNLAGGTTTAYADADVELFEELAAEEEDGLEDLNTEGSRLEEVKGLSVNFDEAGTLGGVGNSGGVLLSAEALHLLCFLFRHLSLSLIVL
jgi:hypothetical protein